MTDKTQRKYYVIPVGDFDTVKTVEGVCEQVLTRKYTDGTHGMIKVNSLDTPPELSSYPCFDYEGAIIELEKVEWVEPDDH
jgi:hypothetical protein